MPGCMRLSILKQPRSLLSLCRLFPVKLNFELIFIISFLATPIVILQAYFLNEVIVTQADIKALLCIWIAALLFRMAIERPICSFAQLFGLVLFVWFIYANFISIMLVSAPFVGSYNALKAFLYNYSLLLVVVPLFFIFKYQDEFVYNKLRLTIAKIVFFMAVISAIFGIAQAFSANYIFPDSTITVLTDGDFVKFDHISNIQRVSSFFKSPLEFGIYCSFFSGLCLCLYASEKRFVFAGLFVIFSFAAMLTLSRTAILIMLVNILCNLFLILKRRSVVRALFFVFCLLLAGPVIYTIATLSEIDFINTATDPTNLFIRLNNWSELLNGLGADMTSLVAGQGVVQNGSYGDYHSLIIDNTYLGVLLAGGIISVILLFAIILITFYCYFTYQRNNYSAASFLFKCSFSFALSFLVGGITENLMHLWYMFYFALILPFIVPADVFSTLISTNGITSRGSC